MAVSFRETQYAENTGTSVTVTKPTGTVDGDLLVATARGISGITPPSGWSLIRDTFGFGTFYKVASGEGASFTFSFAGSTLSKGMVSCFTGSSSWVLDVEGGGANASGSVNVCAPGVTTTQNSDLMWFAGATSAARTVTPATGYTEPSGGDVNGINHAYKLDQGASGATGDIVATADAATTTNVAHIAAFKIATDITIPLVTAGATAGVSTPTPFLTVLPPVPASTATANLPIPMIRALGPMVTAAGQAYPLTGIAGSVTITAPLVTASGGIVAPVIRVVVTGMPLSGATAAAGAPQLAFGITMPVVAATAAVRLPTIPLGPITLSMPVAQAIAEAVDAAVLAFQQFAIDARIVFAPVISFDLTSEPEISLSLSLTPAEGASLGTRAS